MKLKLDENLGAAAAALMTGAGFDVSTVVDQQMMGWSDADLFEACAAEGRAIVTFDLDFANPFRFDPAGAAGLIVLRPGPTHSRTAIVAVLERFVLQLATSDPTGRLWIVEPERVRQYESEDG